jgi:hypothetical protein
MRSSIYVLTHYSAGGKLEKNEMGGVCSSDGEEERCIQGFGGGNPKERGHWGDSGVDGRIILRWLFKR